MDVQQILAGGMLLLMTIAAVLSWKSVGKRAAGPLALFAGVPYFWLVGSLPIRLRLAAIGVGVVASLIMLAVLGLLRPLRWMLLTGLATMVLLVALEFYPIKDTAIRNTLLALTAVSATGFIVFSVGSVVKEAKYHLANR